MDQKQIIFLLHGMGTHEDKWEDEFIGAMTRAYDQYPLLKKKPIKERFEFVPVSYDRIFRQLVETWATNASVIGKMGESLGNPLPAKIVKWLASAGDLKDNFACTHAADVLLYRGIRLVRERVCTHVAAQMIKAINQQHKDWGQSAWSVVAHSLGTAVIHDTLARMTANNQDWDDKLAFSAGNEQATAVMMVANVSKVLEVKTGDEPYDAYGQVVDGKTRYTVAPGYPGQPGRICNYYLSARHKLDPFTRPKTFAPQKWPDQAALDAVPARYQSIEVEHIHQANVHDFGHTMKHPRVHVPLFRALVSPDHIPPEDYDKAVAKFPDFAVMGDDAAIKLRQKLLDVLPAVSEEWPIIGSLWAAYVKATGEQP